MDVPGTLARARRCFVVSAGLTKRRFEKSCIMLTPHTRVASVVSSCILLICTFYLTLHYMCISRPCIFVRHAPQKCNFIISTPYMCRIRAETTACVHQFRQCPDARPPVSLQINTPRHITHRGSHSIYMPVLGLNRTSGRACLPPTMPQNTIFTQRKTPQMERMRATCCSAPTPMSRCIVQRLMRRIQIY